MQFPLTLVEIPRRLERSVCTDSTRPMQPRARKLKRFENAKGRIAALEIFRCDMRRERTLTHRDVQD